MQSNDETNWVLWDNLVTQYPQDYELRPPNVERSCLPRNCVTIGKLLRLMFQARTDPFLSPARKKTCSSRISSNKNYGRNWKRAFTIGANFLSLNLADVKLKCFAIYTAIKSSQKYQKLICMANLFLLFLIDIFIASNPQWHFPDPFHDRYIPFVTHLRAFMTDGKIRLCLK